MAPAVGGGVTGSATPTTRRCSASSRPPRPSPRAIILVRHASARNKKAWHDAGHPDDLHPAADPLGHGQAKLLGQILSCFGPAQVISSPAERCLATVEPYAALAGGVVVASRPSRRRQDDKVLEE